ncbi:MAG TPA: hypothetical protein VNK43_04755 [Gemmatimonadales bacterium]|nr:hypothetical protein [Gemmatimonadales bacterium]
MTSRTKIVTVALILAFVALLLYGTLASQRAECEVCVEFRGGRNCASASAASEAEAAAAAQTTACGPLARGMDASIACGRTPPVTRVCRAR